MQSFADSIIAKETEQVAAYLQYGIEVNILDEYGFTPLIEAAIADDLEISKMLLDYGAEVNAQDSTGGTALHWAVENNNIKLVLLLLRKGANPNSYNFSGQPVLIMPLLRQQNKLKKILMSAGANLEFAQDFINTKLLGHMFELIGTANIIDIKNNLVEIDFEGFIFEFSLAIIADSLAQYKNHYAARNMRNYGDYIQVIVDVLYRAAKLIKYQQYHTDLTKSHQSIKQLIEQEPLIIPIGYEGHAITFIKVGTILVKCDRREDSRLYDSVVFYQINRSDRMTTDFIKHLIYDKQGDHFINVELNRFLELEVITEIKVAAQISGNCSWANVEACIPALFFLFFSRTENFQGNIVRYKNMALTFFQKWRQWNKDRALNFCIQSFKQADVLRKGCKAEILAAILFQSCKIDDPVDRDRIEQIMEILTAPRYEPLLQNYIKSYVYEDLGEEGKHFMRLLKSMGYIPPKTFRY